MKIKNKSRLADMSLFVIAFIWGASFVIIKDSLDAISPMWLIAARFTIATVVACIAFAPIFKRMTKKCFFSGLMTGVLLYFSFLMQTTGAKYTTASKNALITATYVVLVPFIIWLVRKKRPSLIQLITAATCLAGIAMLTLTNGFGKVNIGDALTLVAGLLFALHIVVLDYITQKYDPLLLSLTQIIGAAVTGVICAFTFDYKSLPGTFTNGRVIFSVCFLGLLSTFLAYVVQTTAQKYTAPSHASLIMSLECVFASFMSMLFLHDIFTPLMWVGFMFAVSSVFVSAAADSISPKLQRGSKKSRAK